MCPKNGFFINQSIKSQNKDFWALTPSFLRFCPNKKNWNIFFNYFEQLLLHTFCPQIIFIFPFPIGITEISEKKQFDPLKLSGTQIFLVGYLYRSVIPHHRKKINNQRGYTFIFLRFLIWSFFWNSLYCFILNFYVLLIFFVN